ncbi:MAG TPA: hypothetical protein VMT77_00795 [Gemmatimonadales bacterium]|nr:hypothetical protein [Gemmatimonadales bacterium]
MAFDYRGGTDADPVVLVGSGRVMMHERVACIDRMLGDPQLARDAGVLIDVRAVENPPSASEIPAIAALIHQIRARFNGRVALLSTTAGHVTASDLVAFAADAPQHVAAFTSEDSACAWLAEAARQAV